MEFPSDPFTGVYVIYDADVLSDGSRFIDQMSPLVHMPAGHNGEAKAERERIAGLFTQTEGDDQYDYGYLGNESGEARYFPVGYLDKEALEPAPDDMEPDDPRIGRGYHRKWVAELTRDEWLIFADAYLIDLDSSGYPQSYEETMGSLTEFGHLEAVNVDNREGWNDHSDSTVIDSGMYISFAYESEQRGE